MFVCLSVRPFVFCFTLPGRSLKGVGYTLKIGIIVVVGIIDIVGGPGGPGGGFGGP